MTGADIIVKLLSDDAGLTALVPVGNIKLGALPQGVALPALLVRTISQVDRQPLKRGSRDFVTERVSVTVRARDYREQRAIMKLTKRPVGWTGELETATGISVRSAGLGPDLLGPGDSFEQARDLRVSFEDDAA